MPGITNIGIDNGIGVGSFSPWSAFWASLISATVENAAPTKIVMTFSQANTSLLATDFTIPGNPITLLERDATNKILTLTVSVAVIYGDSLIIIFVKTGGTKAVTNNVLYKMLLTKTGDGTGVSTITLTVSADMTITLGANAKFYSDAGGTLNESASFIFLAGAARTRYIKCTTGTAIMTFDNPLKVTSWGDWISAANAASLSGDISKLGNLTYLKVVGSNTLSGNVALMTGLTNLRVEGTNTLSGSIAGLTSLDYILIAGNTTISGSVAALTNLTFMSLSGSNTVSGSIEALTSLTNLSPKGNNTITGSIAAITTITAIEALGNNTITGSIAALTSLTYLNFGGLNTISGDINPIVSDLTECVITGNNRMVDYTAGATWGNSRVTINPAVGYGYDSTEIDNMLIDMAASVALISKTITLRGSSAARTAASNAAVATLEGVGRTCTVLTN